MEPARGNAGNTHAASVGKLCISEGGVVLAPVGILHAQCLLHIQATTLLLQSYGNSMPLQIHQILWQSYIAGSEADAWVGGVVNTHKITIPAIVTVVVGHDNLAPVNCDADEVTKGESSLCHILFADVEHSRVKLIVRHNLAHQHRLIHFLVVIRTRANKQHYTQ